MVTTPHRSTDAWHPYAPPPYSRSYQRLWQWLAGAGGGIVTGGQYADFRWCSSYTLKPCNHYDSKNDTLPSCEKGIPSRTPQCPTMCDKSSTYKGRSSFVDDRRSFASAYAIDKAPASIMHDIMTHGPVTAGMNVYEDWLTYRSGVYKWNGQGSIVGGHAVRILGWGVSESGLDYWLVANSFGTKWGDQGMFKIVRGEDTCVGGGEGTCIEDSVVAGTFL